MKQLEKRKEDIFEKIIKDILQSLKKNFRVFIVYVIFSFTVILLFHLTKYSIYKNIYEYIYKIKINNTIFSTGNIFSEVKETTAFLSRKKNYEIIFSDFNTENRLIKIKTQKEFSSDAISDYQNDFLFNLFLLLTFDTFDQNYTIIVADYNQKQLVNIDTSSFFSDRITLLDNKFYFKLNKGLEDNTLIDLRNILYNELKNTNFLYKKKIRDEINKLRYEIFLLKQKNLIEVKELNNENQKINDLENMEKAIQNLTKFIMSDIKIDENHMNDFKFSKFDNFDKFFSLKLTNNVNYKKFDIRLVKQIITIFAINIFFFIVLNFLYHKIYHKIRK